MDQIRSSKNLRKTNRILTLLGMIKKVENEPMGELEKNGLYADIIYYSWLIEESYKGDDHSHDINALTENKMGRDFLYGIQKRYTELIDTSKVAVIVN